MRFGRRWLVAVAVVAAIWGSPGEADAEITIAEWDDEENSFLLAGYLRSISGVQALGYGEPIFEPESALNAAVARFGWSVYFGRDVELQLANELSWQVQSARSFGAATGGEEGGGALFGLGASRGVDPTLDLQTTFVDGTGFALGHDIDRLAAKIYTDAADLTIGRQGITWGKSMVFPVIDLWTRFSPFEIDTEYKPGIDAVRALFYPSFSTEIDVVIADRGSLENLSGGVRASGTIDKLELYGAAGKFWDEIMAVAGATYVFERVKLRAEGVLPWDLDVDELRLPRVTAGVEWYAADWAVGTEYHFNGLGADDAAGYTDVFTSAEYLRGESYFLGRHYAGLFASYNKIPDVELAMSAIGNLGDPSLLVAPNARYRVAENTSLGLGAYISAGEEPLLGPETQFRSEFGAYGNFYYVELATYY